MNIPGLLLLCQYQQIFGKTHLHFIFYVKGRIKNISGILLISLFLVYLGSLSFFYHQHEIDGKLFYHSHPYKPFNDNQPANHHHSGDQLLTIGLLSIYLAVAAGFLVLTCIQKGIFTKGSFFNRLPFISDLHADARRMRAPPPYLPV